MKNEPLLWKHTSSSCDAFDRKAYGIDVEGVGSHKSDSVLQLIVVHPVLVILVGRHGEGEGPHAVLAPVGQLHLQRDGVTHLAVHHDITVAKLAVDEDICKARKSFHIMLGFYLKNSINPGLKNKIK